MFNLSVLAMHGWDIPVQCATNQHYGHPTTLPCVFCIRQLTSRRCQLSYIFTAQISSLYIGHFVLLLSYSTFCPLLCLGSVLITLIFNLDWKSFVDSHTVKVYPIRIMFVFGRLPFPAKKASPSNSVNSVVILLL